MNWRDLPIFFFLLLAFYFAGISSARAHLDGGTYSSSSAALAACNAASVGNHGGSSCFSTSGVGAPSGFDASWGHDSFGTHRWWYLAGDGCPAGYSVSGSDCLEAGASPEQEAAARAAAEAAAAAAGFNATAVTAAGDAAVATIENMMAGGASFDDAASGAVRAGEIGARESVYAQTAGAYAAAVADLSACVASGKGGCQSILDPVNASRISAGLPGIGGYVVDGAAVGGVQRRWHQTGDGKWQVFDFNLETGVPIYLGQIDSLLPFGADVQSSSVGVPTGAAAVSAVAAQQPVAIIAPSGGGSALGVVTQEVGGMTIKYFDSAGDQVATAVKGVDGQVAITGTFAGINPASDFNAVSQGGSGLTGPLSINEAGTPSTAGTIFDVPASSLDTAASAITDLIEGVAGSGQQTVLGFEFPVWSLPSASCAPFSLTFKGWSGVYDWCPFFSDLRTLVAWFYGLLTALFVWRSGVRSMEG